MNPTGTKTWAVVGLVIGLAAAGCGEPDVIGAYCSVHDYCFAGYDLADCMDARKIEEREAIAVGEACHEAYLAFHSCIGELSCSDLDEYYEDGSHCGTEHSAWQSRCSTD